MTVAVRLVPESCAGVTVAVAPAGRPEADTVTTPVKPPPRVSVTVVVPVPPCGMESVVGLALTWIVPVLPVGPSSP